MHEKTLFILTITSILLLLIIINTQPTTIIEGNIQKIKYYENLCKITLDNEQEILIFTKQILNTKKEDAIRLEVKKENNKLIAQSVTKLN